MRNIYLVWNEKLKLARLPLKYFANGHSFFVQVTVARVSPLLYTHLLVHTCSSLVHTRRDLL